MSRRHISLIFRYIYTGSNRKISLILVTCSFRCGGVTLVGTMALFSLTCAVLSKRLFSYGLHSVGEIQFQTQKQSKIGYQISEKQVIHQRENLMGDC